MAVERTDNVKLESVTIKINSNLGPPPRVASNGRVSGGAGSSKPSFTQNATIEVVNLNNYSSSANTTYKSTLALENKTFTLPYFGRSYDVISTKYNIVSLEADLKKWRVFQESGKYKGSCLDFSYVYAYCLATNTRVTDLKTTNFKELKLNKKAVSGRFNKITSGEKSAILRRVYDEIQGGNPVILQVNGNKEGTIRHFVVVVGIADGADPKNLSEADLLILDTYDGKVEKMGDRDKGDRFMTTGKDTGRDYDGYCIYTLKGSSSGKKTAYADDRDNKNF